MSPRNKSGAVAVGAGMQHYDVIWIGTGQATGTVVPRLTGAGKRVALIEGGKVGGSCVKLRLHAHQDPRGQRPGGTHGLQGPAFGINTSDATIDMSVVMGRMNAMRDNSGMEQWLRSMDGVDFYAEYAEFVSERDVQVGDEVISGDTIVIHTGTRSLKVPIAGIDDVDWLDNAGLLSSPRCPTTW